jgi:hypothetical protein
VRVALPQRPRLQPETKLGDNAEVGLAEQPIDGMDALDPMGDTYWQLVRRLKRCLDPDGILAPGRYLPPEAGGLKLRGPRLPRLAANRCQACLGEVWTGRCPWWVSRPAASSATLRPPPLRCGPQ